MQSSTGFARSFVGLFLLNIAVITPSIAAQEGAAVLNKIGTGRYTLFNVGKGANSINLKTQLSRDEILRGPDWTPGTPAPLSPEDAARIALKALIQLAGEKNIAGWGVTGIRLSALYGAVYRKWYYTISFGKMGRYKDPSSGVFHTIIETEGDVDIAMDGTSGLKLGR